MMIAVSGVKPTSLHQDMLALRGGLAKYLVCKKMVSCPEQLQKKALASTLAGPCSLLDLILNFLIRGTPGQKLVNIS